MKNKIKIGMLLLVMLLSANTVFAKTTVISNTLSASGTINIEETTKSISGGQVIVSNDLSEYEIKILKTRLLILKTRILILQIRIRIFCNS